MLTTRELRVIGLWGIGMALVIAGVAVVFYGFMTDTPPTAQSVLLIYLPVAAAVPFLGGALILNRGHPPIMEILRNRKNKVR
jgi:hypothetical protein